MLKKMGRLLTVVAVCVCGISASADTFGSGANQFDIDFVNISGDAGDLGSWPAGSGYTFSGANRDAYRMGTFEITNDQWTKFQAELGVGVPVTGNPGEAYNTPPQDGRPNVPTDCVSWYEAAQFVNWLNTSTGHQPAYKFSGTQGTGGYSLGVWESGDDGYDADNPYRNSNAYYFMPTEDEWVKAAYWNGTALQTWATLGDSAPVAGVDTNFNYAVGQLWNPGSGSEELNGTYDMMGNVFEWLESPYYSGNYVATAYRGTRGGSFDYIDTYLKSSSRLANIPYLESSHQGFRVASSVPEPAALSLLALGGLMLTRRRR